MMNLSHWDFAEQFVGFDAAALILGIEPAEASDEQGRIGPVIARMKKCYENARSVIADVQRQNGTRADFKKYLSPEELLSKGLMLRVTDPLSGMDEWLNDAKFFSFDKQEFSRDELARWLSAIAIKSAYRFDLKQPGAAQDTLGRWPWGGHHTELLGHLESAARRFWVNYDPSDTTTAPTKVTVSNWLKTERKVSGQMADAIASMLRPDDLPTGPRR